MPAPPTTMNGRKAPAERLERVGAAVSTRRGLRLLLATLAGAGLALTLPPFDILPALAAYAALVWLLRAADIAGGQVAQDGARQAGTRALRERALVGFAFGFGFHLAGLWWIGAAFLVDAEAFALLLPFAVIGLPLLLASFHALAALLAGLAPASLAWRAVGLAVALSASEWLRGVVMTGFPWNAAGISLTGVPLLAQSAALVGLSGLAIPAVLFGALPAVLVERGSRWLGLAVGLLAGAMLAYGGARIAAQAEPDPDAPRLRIVQPAVPQREKWTDAARPRIWQRLLALTREGGPVDAVIWPETAIPFLYRTPSAEQLELAEALAGTPTLITGAVVVEASATGRAASNAILVLDGSASVVARYDKVHLVPFGEYLPASGWLGALGLTALVQGAADFRPGAARIPLDHGALPPFEPLICYEVIFSGPGLGEAVRWIVNVTNDAWFGDTPGPRQHLRHAAVRAIERGLPLARAANNGISAIIDPTGRPLASLSLDERGTIEGRLPPPRVALYNHLGDALLMSVWLAAFLACAWRRLRASVLGRTLPSV